MRMDKTDDTIKKNQHETIFIFHLKASTVPFFSLSRVCKLQHISALCPYQSVHSTVCFLFFSACLYSNFMFVMISDIKQGQNWTFYLH